MPQARQDNMTRTGYEVHLTERLDTPSVTMHYHSGFYEIFCLLSGDVYYHLDMQRHRLVPGSLLLIPPDTPHRPVHISGSEPYVRMFLWITEDYLQRLSTPQSNLALGLYAPGIYVLQPYDVNTLKANLLALSALGDCLGYGQDIQRDTLLSTVLLTINQISQNGATVSPTLEPPSALVGNALTYIDDHLAESLSIDIIAAHTFVSRSFLEKQFAKQMGISIYSYIIQRRMLRARQLLTQGIPASLAAEKVGYTNYATFYKAYIKAFELTPNKTSKSDSK